MSEENADLAADVHVSGPTVSPPGLGRDTRWPLRLADLGPFGLVDAAATVSTDRRKLAVTLVNRSEHDPEPADLLLRGHTFTGPATVRTITAERDPSRRQFPDVATVHLEEGTTTGTGGQLCRTLPHSPSPSSKRPSPTSYE